MKVFQMLTGVQATRSETLSEEKKKKIKQTKHLSTGSFTADFLLQYCTNFLLRMKSMIIFLPLYSVNLVTQLTGQKITNIFIKLPFLLLCCGKVLVNHLKRAALLIRDA